MESDPGILTGSVIMEELTPFIISNKDKLHLWTPMTFFASIIKWCKAQPLKEWQLLVCTEDSVKTAETTAVINKVGHVLLLPLPTSTQLRKTSFFTSKIRIF